MTLSDHLRKQFAYNAWANREVLAAIQAASGADARTLQLMSHILAAERLWLERLTRKPQSVPVWPEFKCGRCETEAEELAQLWVEYLNLVAGSDLSQVINYKNTKGEAWTSTIIDVLTHVVMHSAYHRGQIASHMREAGHTPAYTDFIHGVRQGLVR
jgi:uncharacterized damage-inducible protein DinB